VLTFDEDVFDVEAIGEELFLDVLLQLLGNFIPCLQQFLEGVLASHRPHG